MTPFGDGVWFDTDPVRVVGTRLTTTMTVLRLAGDSLLVHSPVRLTPERRGFVERLGRVDHLYAPNTFHHLSLGDWSAAFPSAKVHAPRGLSKKRPELRIDRRHTEPEPSFDGLLDEIAVDGFRLEESVLVHRPSGVLVAADLVHNVGRPADAWSKFYTRAMGFYDRVALSRAIRWTAFSDRAAARRSLDRVLVTPFERILVGHGAPVDSGAKHALAAAYAFLPLAK